MSLIDVSNLTFRYDGSYENIFENVSFQLDSNWKLGFTGRNGRGKTTFLKLLLGEYEYSGSITADVGFEYFPYEVSSPERSAGEVIRQVCPGHERWELLRELSLLRVSEEVLGRAFSSLSGGEQAKLLLAALFLNENNFLLIDEPTNHLDLEARRVVSDYLRTKSGFILVSHDREFLDNCIDHILSINRNNIEIQAGSFSGWLQNKRQRDEFELSENARLKKDIRRLSDSASRVACWADKVEGGKSPKGPRLPDSKVGDRGYIGHQAARMQARASAIVKRKERAAAEKGSLLKNLERAEPLKLSPLAYRGEKLAELRDFSLSFGEKNVFSGLSFDIRRGERIALIGKNGSGKSSLLKLLCGEETAASCSGNFWRGSGLLVSYVPQESAYLHGALASFIETRQIDGTLLKAILRKLDFSRAQFEHGLDDYSDGQKKKLLIAASLCERAHLYIWDEPLNYIDLLSRIQIEQLLLEYCPTFLFVEHDAAFCRSVATKTVLI